MKLHEIEIIMITFQYHQRMKLTDKKFQRI